jgi:hypothetical protein
MKITDVSLFHNHIENATLLQSYGKPDADGIINVRSFYHIMRKKNIVSYTGTNICGDSM